MRALETFKALGIDFVSYSEQMDTSTPAGKMVFTVLGAVAELERSLGSTHAANPCNEGSDGTWTCALTLSTEYPAEIVWNPSTSKTITVDASFATYETLSNSTVHFIAAYQIAIGNLPVLVVGSRPAQ
jgi:Resolvase, N terminal domain